MKKGFIRVNFTVIAVELKLFAFLTLKVVTQNHVGAAKENRLSQSKFVCQVCGYTANADVNGARNILAAGHAVLACGGMVQSGRPLKQEPEAEQSAVTH
jgi:hypothetical protein